MQQYAGHVPNTSKAVCHLGQYGMDLASSKEVGSYSSVSKVYTTLGFGFFLLVLGMVVGRIWGIIIFVYWRRNLIGRDPNEKPSGIFSAIVFKCNFVTSV